MAISLDSEFDAGCAAHCAEERRADALIMTAAGERGEDEARVAGGVGEVWRLTIGSRVDVLALWTRPMGREVRVTVDGDWQRGETSRDGAGLIDLELEWRTQLYEGMAVILSGAATWGVVAATKNPRKR